MNPLILLTLITQVGAPMPGESFYEAARREEGRPSIQLEQTEIEFDKFGKDNYIVTERPTIQRKPNNSFGTQKLCEVDKQNGRMICNDFTIRR